MISKYTVPCSSPGTKTKGSIDSISMMTLPAMKTISAAPWNLLIQMTCLSDIYLICPQIL